MKGKERFFRLAAFALVALVMVVMSLPPSALAADLRELDKIVKAGKIKVGMELIMKKRCWIDPKTGKPDGFEVDIIRELEKRMGVKAEIIDLPWDGLIPALVSGRIDLICTGMARLEKRALAVQFSQPMWALGMDLLIRTKDKDKLTGWEAVDQPDVKLAFTVGAASEIYIKENIKNAKAMGFPGGDQAGLALASGQVDAWLEDDFYHAMYAEEHPELMQVPGTSVWPATTGMAVRRGSDLMPWINLFLFNTKKEGFFGDLLKKYDLPQSMNAKWAPENYWQ